MALIIRVTSYKGLPPSQEIRAQFDSQGGSIGRSPDNHLVLPDPEKYISRLHASILFTAGQYFIQDSSTGGTYLYDSDGLLQQTRAALHDGEKLRIGEYELVVSITDAGSGGFAPSLEIPVRQLDLMGSSLPDDPFFAAQPVSKPVEADFFGSFIEQPESSPIHQSFTPPQVSEIAPGSTGVGVDDLDFSDLLSKLDALPGASSKPLSQPELPSLPADFFADEEVQEIPQPIEVHAQAQPFKSAEPSPLHDPFSGFDTPVFSSEQTHPVEPAMASLVTEPVRPSPVKPPLEHVSSVMSDQQLLREFLAGAGIGELSGVPAEQWPALMRTSGALLRNMVDGLMQVLRARAELKSQFRVSVTTMRSVDNNPLKFTPSVDDAMKLMLAPTNPGFLPPQTAVSEGFRDIMNHQIAMTAGIQAALAEILVRFDPQLIEKNHVEGVLFQKKAKCWEYYVEEYPQLKALAQEELFGDAFADAYEKQMLLLNRPSKQP
jgi:type VI secretion system FHA domain protein